MANLRLTQDYETLAARYDTTSHPYKYDHPGWHPYLNGTDLHSLQSITKNVTSAALGISIDNGYITGVDFPVMPFF